MKTKDCILNHYNHIPDINYTNHRSYGLTFKKKHLFESMKSIYRILPYIFSELIKRLKIKIKYFFFIKKAKPISSNKIISESNYFMENGVIQFKVDDGLINDLRYNLNSIIGKKMDKIIPNNSDQIFFNEERIQIKIEKIKKQIDKIISYTNLDLIACQQLNCKQIRIGGAKLRIQSRNSGYCPISPSPTEYFHVDSSVPNTSLRLIIYLNRVSMENGPFSYIPSSHKLKESTFKSAIRSANHKSMLQDMDNGNRKAFHALPKFLQYKAEFGNDIYNEKDIRNLIKYEKHFVSKDGQVLLANISGIHRGGIVKNNKRISLQINVKGD